MLREILTNTIKQAAIQCGYSFYKGFEYRLQQQAQVMPAVWLTPPEMIKIEGVNSGYITYRTTLTLLTLNNKFDEDQKEKSWDKMERDIITMVKKVQSSDKIHLVEKLKTTPAEFTLTNRGEVSLKAECEVKMYFCETSSAE